MIWVTDSNTETSQEHFQAHLTAWRYTQRYGKTPALVHAPTAAIDGSGLGAVFERLQMTGYNNVSAETTLIVGIDTVVGKSLLFPRDDLAAVGGLASFGAMANEDFLMGVAFRKLGAVQLANRATQQVLGEVSVTDFWRRQARWAATRKQTSTGSFYLLEHFTYFGLLWVWLALGLLSWQVVAAVFAFKMVVDGLVQAAWSSRRSLLDPLLVPAKDLVLLAAWSSAIFMRGFSWRGRDLAVNREGNYRDAIPASVEASSVSEPQ
jgi:protein-S-isoprenylcysteine O-methyltransferase Ste14